MAVTRNDVARTANVSPGVVSYVLNGGPRPVSAAARKRVLDAVKALNYRPDGLARSLRMGQTKTLGLVIPDASNPFFAELALATEDAAYARGYAVMVCNSADDIERELTYITSLAERRIDGLVLVSATAGQDLTAITSLQIPVVALDRSPDDSPVSTIRAENHEGASLGTLHLIGHGHRSVAFVAGPDTSVSDARRLGWKQTLKERGVPPGIEIAAPFTYAGGRGASEQLIGHGSVTAVLVSSDVQAIGIISGLNAAGLKVPNDVAVVSIDGTKASVYSIPALTTIAQPIRKMGEAAVFHLIDNPSETVHLVLSNDLVVRGSCGCDC
ncbi:LacI family DNA-binding transcriptional regulator [Pseudarthrobacter phenanthrenivorans]|uniref:LacI family DNA-binding transcriptional regulator n=1 Tax=Pseudarthrobacter phenanthrenivorans TaxID=361575 RepID=UPI00345068F4